MFVTVEILADYLNLSPRRCQQLAKEGVIVKIQNGQYNLRSSVQGFILYLKSWRSSAEIPVTYADLAELGGDPIEVRRMLRAGLIKKIKHGKYDVSGCVRACIKKGLL